MILVILAGLAVAAITLTTATVDLELRSQTVTGSTPVTFVASDGAQAEGVITVPAQYVTVDVTLETLLQPRALTESGLLPPPGLFSSPTRPIRQSTFRPGPTGTGDTGVEFAFTTEVSVPPASETAPGETEATVETITLGTAANLKPGELSGVLESGVFFSNRLQELTGGTDQDGTVVSEEDIEAARSAATEALTGAASDRFAQTLQSNVMAIPSTFAIEEQAARRSTMRRATRRKR